MLKLRLRVLSVAGSCVLALIAATLVSTGRIANAQAALPIEFGQTVTGEIKVAPDNEQLYSFSASAGDSIALTMTRTSGNLRPVTRLVDPSKSGDAQFPAQTTLSDDGKTATLERYTFDADGTYEILASRENLADGKTTGKYTLTLTLLDSTAPTATATRGPKPRATTTPRLSPSPTDKPIVLPEGVKVFTVGTAPSYSVWDGNQLYVANDGGGTVSILDGDGNLTNTIPVGGVPFAMAWDGARLWVSDLGTASKPGKSVTLFDSKGKKIATYRVGQQPFSLSYDPDDQKMWIALFDDNEVVGVDAKGKIVTTVDMNGTGNNPNTVLWAGGQLWVTLSGDAKADNKVAIVDGSGTISGPFDVGQSPADLAWDEADGLLFVPNALDNTVTALDSTGKVKGTYPVGRDPIAVAWDGKALWVTLFDDKAVEAISPDGNKLTQIDLGISPNGIVYDGLGNVWIALQGTTDKPGNTVARVPVSLAAK